MAKQINLDEQTHEIVKAGEYAITESGATVAQYLGEALAPGETLSISVLPTIKLPAGESTVWTLPDGEAAKELQGVILLRQPVRAYWREAFSGESVPPDCSSMDNIHGIGDPGGLCATCPLNAWGSDDKGIGKACRQITRLFLMMPGGLLPVLLPLPPSSYKSAQTYVLGVASRGQAVSEVVTGIGLETEKSRGGIRYARASFRVVRPLTDDERASIGAYREAILPFLRGAPVEAAEAVEMI